MYQTEKLEEYSAYNEKCELLLQQPEIRFAGVLDFMGNLVAGGLKKGITPLEDEADRRKLYMELVLRVTTRKDFDYNLGQVKYSASRREKVVVMSFPLSNTILFVSTIPNIDIDKTAKKIMKLYYGV